MCWENHSVCRSKFKVILHKFVQIMCFCDQSGGHARKTEGRRKPSRCCTTNFFRTDSSVPFPFQRLPHMLDIWIKTDAFLYVITNLHCCLLSFFLPFSGSNVLSFVSCILRNFDCIKVCRSGLWSYWHYAGSPPTNLPPPYQTPSTFEFLVSKETVVLHRWERSKQKFGFIKRVDKGWITTAKDLGGWRFES